MLESVITIRLILHMFERSVIHRVVFELKPKWASWRATEEDKSEEKTSQGLTMYLSTLLTFCTALLWSSQTASATSRNACPQSFLSDVRASSTNGPPPLAFPPDRPGEEVEEMGADEEGVIGG
jgi:hypothetical protein